MRKIECSLIREKVKNLFLDANFNIEEDIINAYKKYADSEVSPTGKEILNIMLDNVSLASKDKVAICQDTGMAVVFIDVGQDVYIVGGFVEDAINDGVRDAYKEGYLRKSVVQDPLDRINTKDNTPAIIHYNIIKGDEIHIKVMAKGFGSENMSALKMLKPSDGIEGVKEFVVETVKNAGPNPCPPTIIGVGIGGTMEMSAILSKKALFRSLDDKNENELYNNLEDELLKMINNLGIGPQGLGGTCTSFGVKILTSPTHIAGLPVSVNISCHASRHKQCKI